MVDVSKLAKGFNMRLQFQITIIRRSKCRTAVWPWPHLRIFSQLQVSVFSNNGSVQ